MFLIIGVCIPVVILILTIVIGYIARGFMKIPQNQDKKIVVLNYLQVSSDTNRHK